MVSNLNSMLDVQLDIQLDMKLDIKLNNAAVCWIWLNLGLSLGLDL